MPAALTSTMFDRGGIIYRTLLAVARQRPGLDADRCRALIELLALAERLRRRAWPARSSADLDEQRFLALVVLFALHPAPATPAALSDYSGIPAESVRRALIPLDQRGWIQHSKVRTDDGATLIRLSAPGRAAADRRILRFLRLLSAVVSDVSQVDVIRLMKLCGKIAAPEHVRLHTLPPL